MPNYDRGKIKRNDVKEYEYFFDKREVRHIDHYGTKTLASNKSLRFRGYTYTWRQGDKLYKLAARNYGNFRFWWVIALINNIKSEADLEYGQILLIPIDITPIINKVNE